MKSLCIHTFEHEDNVGAGQEIATQFMLLSPQDMKYEKFCVVGYVTVEAIPITSIVYIYLIVMP